MSSNAKKNGWGGRRPNAGRKGRNRRHLELSKQDASTLYLLTKFRRSLFNNPDLTEEEVVGSLVEQEWKEIDEEYQKNAEIAGEYLQ